MINGFNRILTTGVIDEMAVKILISVDSRVIEAIVENYSEANRLWSRWCVTRYHNGLPMGSATVWEVVNES